MLGRGNFDDQRFHDFAIAAQPARHLAVVRALLDLQLAAQPTETPVDFPHHVLEGLLRRVTEHVFLSFRVRSGGRLHGKVSRVLGRGNFDDQRFHDFAIAA